MSEKEREDIDQEKCCFIDGGDSARKALRGHREHEDNHPYSELIHRAVSAKSVRSQCKVSARVISDSKNVWCCDELLNLLKAWTQLFLICDVGFEYLDQKNACGQLISNTKDLQSHTPPQLR